MEAPWSVGTGGRPTLTGTWEGQLSARRGARYRLFLDLRYSGRLQGAGTSDTPDNLEGTAHVCTPTGETWDYAVSGRADRAAENVQLRLTFGDPARSALDLPLSGTWHGDRFAVEVTDNPFQPDGSFKPGPRVSSSEDPDDSFLPTTLEKADRTGFDNACRALHP
jgi:hypothetical protein